MISTELKWRPLVVDGLAAEAVKAIETRIEAVLSAWERTPYVPGQRCRGVGVDCLRYLTAVLDELNGYSHSPIPNLPQDVALHDRRLAIRTMSKILRTYGPGKVVRDGTVEPGDVVVTGPEDGGPGHAMLVGGQPATIWHATNLRVMRTGLVIVGQKVFRIYRPQKGAWLR